MPAPEIIHQLVITFDQNRESYRSGKYNEAQLRQQFLDKFFTALGWDVGNTHGYPPENCEVVIEDSLEVEGTSKAPDYCFRLGHDRKFFVEAKKPAIDIKYDIHPAYQLRRYAWNAHLSLSILTDFEELSIYNTKAKPNPTDSPATCRDKYYHYTEYIEKWDEIAAIFSREAVWNGSFDKFAAESKGKKGTTEVDDDILATISEWRKSLAINIALRNKPLIHDEAQLNFAVQMTIDRILFLRICEDRGIEPEDQLKSLAAAPAIYPRLVELFKRADTKYNSGLFHFSAEKHETSPADTFTPSLIIDDKVLKEIINGIYYPCPYIFKEIPVEILGQVYEQFLGKVIRLTPAGLAKVEEKPEVRKAGGVYYTPTYIVDYIVENTVGELLKGKTPEQASALKVVDPACGSGSFLLGAFEYLLNWHYQYYTTHDPETWAKKKNPPIYPLGGGWRLTTSEKKRILTNNLHGVDIDAQAVEVTKLSLLLKVLEEESGQLTLGFERVLPDLGRNIQCGNSLIGWDYFEGQLTIDEEERKRVNPFDWQRAFPQVFSQGGFDAVIGNPPYVRQETLGNDKKYFQAKYKVYAGTADLYSYFIEKGINLLAPNGQFSFIVANKWMRANYGGALRKWLKTKCIEEITDFGDLPVFENATTYPLIIRVSNHPVHNQPKITDVKSLDFVSLSEYIQKNCVTLDQSKFSENGWSLVNPDIQRILEKLNTNSMPLGKYVEGKIYYGIKTGLNEAFVIDEEVRNQLIHDDPKSAELIKPFLIGRDIKRYQPPESKRFLILIPKGWTKKNMVGSGNAWKWFSSAYPSIAKHLESFEKAAEKRFDQGDYWWELRACDYYAEFEKPKIIIPSIVQKASYFLDASDHYYSNDKTSIIPLNDLYLLGLLNSRVPDFVMHRISSTKQGGFFEYKPMYLAKLPIHIIDKAKSTEIMFQSKTIELVKHMLNLHKRTPATPQEQEQLAREIAATDHAIDTLVYQLYGLTDAEIKIVEGSN